METICDVAAELLVHHGRLTMTAVADRAGISIGSLYQYFPNDVALLRGLAERHLAAGRDALAQALHGLGPVDVDARLTGALADYLRTAQDPRAAAVMRSIRADPELAALDRADTAHNAAIAAAALGAPHVAAQLALVIDLAGVVSLAAADQPSASRDLLYQTYLRMARVALP